MKTKNFVAVLMASIIAMAMFAPMAAAIDVPIQVPIEVPNEPPEVICKCEGPNPVWPDLSGVPVPVTICAVVCDPNGKGDIASVTATVYNPDGTVKIDDVLMDTAVTCDCDPLKPEKGPAPVYCDRPIDNDPTCQLYKGTFEMTIDQPGGEYRVVVTATDAGELEDKLQNRFFYESIIAFDIDFTMLDFGSITICEPSYVMGDDDMDTVEAPTIHNAGNDPIQIGIHFMGFVPDGGSVPVDTIEMDAKIPGTGEPEWGTLIPISHMIWFDYVLQGYCETVPIDFSLHVKEGTAHGSYTAGIEIEAKEAPHTVLLENKDDSDDYLYEPILDDGKYGTLTYSYDDCSFDFQRYGLGDPTQYCLIYYAEPWPGLGGCCFGPLLADGTLSGLLPDIPNAGDWSYDLAGKKLAKIWLVPCADYTEGVGLNKWNPSEILFDMETIQC